MTTEAESVVFIVDDDASVRRSIQDLLSSVALRSEAFATIKTHQRTKTPLRNSEVKAHSF